MRYGIRRISIEDFGAVAEIYNSNKDFLIHHLGISKVDQAFVEKEVQTMTDLGFLSCVIFDVRTFEICGLIDYKIGSEVYLSLLMLKKSFQKKGIGQEVFSFWESELTGEEISHIRIDVVHDHVDHSITFWEKMGFNKFEEIELAWGEKKNRAIVMKKYVGAKKRNM